MLKNYHSSLERDGRPNRLLESEKGEVMRASIKNMMIKVKKTYKCIVRTELELVKCCDFLKTGCEGSESTKTVWGFLVSLNWLGHSGRH